MIQQPTKKLKFDKLMTALVQGLAEEEKMVLSLTYCEELSFEDTARVLDLTPRVVRKIYVRAITRCLNDRQILDV